MNRDHSELERDQSKFSGDGGGSRSRGRREGIGNRNQWVREIWEMEEEWLKVKNGRFRSVCVWKCFYGLFLITQCEASSKFGILELSSILENKGTIVQYTLSLFFPSTKINSFFFRFFFVRKSIHFFLKKNNLFSRIKN